MTGGLRCGGLAGAVGVLAAVMALVSQLVLGALVLPDEDGQVDALSIVCGAVPGDAAPVHRHPPDGALCPLSAALALPAVVLAPAVEVPAPPAVVVARLAARPPKRAPPGPAVAAAYPRGPPRFA